ncbi:MAG TPA: orotate phosphoribosyltransferase [Catalimonadaceae bacterium]|nr:orotate phosphoribosyltransferase [Catalimonadaceae bacterium]HPI11364.1 orotate phosphoribosyltransferase [Catalimonadaceae bacterium]
MQIFQQQVANNVAGFLLDCQAVKLNLKQPYVWASGWKAPIYTDNRVTLSFPPVRTYIKNQLISLIVNNFPTVECIAGVATGGIPQGALTADEIGIPFVYVRSEAKSHGLKNMIEGQIHEGQKVVVVEDLISTGKSSLKAVEALQEAGAEVLGMVSVFTYGFPQAWESFEKAGIQCFPLTDYLSLIATALQKGIIKDKDIATLEQWRKDPANWGK